jgi:hypothetical protein
MKDKWIKVSDRLPEAIDGYTFSEMVLVAWFGGECAAVAEYCHNTKRWLNRDNKIVVGVTHWMPIVLPEDDCKGMDSKLSPLAKPCPNFTPKEN